MAFSKVVPVMTGYVSGGMLNLANSHSGSIYSVVRPDFVFRPEFTTLPGPLIGWGAVGRFVKQNNENAGQPSGNWCLGPSTGDASEGSGVLPPEKFWDSKCKICGAFRGNMIRSAILNEFLNILTIGTSSPSFPAAFQQWLHHCLWHRRCRSVHPRFS